MQALGVTSRESSGTQGKETNVLFDLTVEMQILDPRLEKWGLPRYESEMAAAVDLYACLEEGTELVLWPDEPAVLVPAGFALHMNNCGVAAWILPRSSRGHKDGVALGNTVGLIDPDYTGPIQISVWNRNGDETTEIRVKPGERIAQLIFLPILRPKFSVVKEFTAHSERGAGGFGSTGTDYIRK